MVFGSVVRKAQTDVTRMHGRNLHRNVILLLIEQLG
jgi:hypothetical protein